MTNLDGHIRPCRIQVGGFLQLGLVNLGDTSRAYRLVFLKLQKIVHILPERFLQSAFRLLPGVTPRCVLQTGKFADKCLWEQIISRRRPLRQLDEGRPGLLNTPDGILPRIVISPRFATSEVGQRHQNGEGRRQKGQIEDATSRRPHPLEFGLSQSGYGFTEQPPLLLQVHRVPLLRLLDHGRLELGRRCLGRRRDTGQLQNSPGIQPRDVGGLPLLAEDGLDVSVPDLT
mmetsp:Transcript_29449/g.69064  ORF Transcript_29449/g.69064 Transcript_29449/m.69064 type:complete len:230 (+) Transcript_29449:938-1627(+)